MKSTTAVQDTNIDFSKVGNYSVRIYQYPDKYAEYNIKVIESKEE